MKKPIEKNDHLNMGRIRQRMMLCLLAPFAVPLLGLIWTIGLAAPSSNTSVLSHDGAWCWFQDPRAVYLGGERNRTVAGWITRSGELEIGAMDNETGEVETVRLKSNWDVDDHNTCSIFVLPDQRLMVFYARHNKRGLFCRRSSQPGEISHWDEEVTVSNSERITYSHPVYLREECRFYVFWRGPSWKPTFATSMDGKDWSPPRILVQGLGKESASIRPYLKLYSDGHSTIHIAFTDGHPRNEEENSVYYLAYKKGAFYRSDGGLIDSIQSSPVQPENCDLVYDGASNGRAWLWDIGADSNQRPMILYTRLPKETEHLYHFGYWDGGQWLNRHIVRGGGWFPETRKGAVELEPHYSGGFALNHQNPFQLFLSREVAGNFEIEKWSTDDLGLSWVVQPLSSRSVGVNVRPVVPRHLPEHITSVLWMQGHYEHYTRFQTRIMLYSTQSDSIP